MLVYSMLIMYVHVYVFMYAQKKNLGFSAVREIESMILFSTLIASLTYVYVFMYAQGKNLHT